VSLATAISARQGLDKTLNNLGNACQDMRQPDQAGA